MRGVVALLLLAGCAPAPRSVAPMVTDFARAIDSLRREAHIPGLAAVLLRDTTVIMAEGFGFADVERHIPVTPDTPFNIASVSKTVAGVVAMRLVEQGKLDLDRPMTSFRGFDEFCADVTKEGGIFFGDYQCGPELTLRRVLSMTANGTPGTRFLYNPPSFSWASRPMAEVGGKPYSDLVAELVFAPAGMTRSARSHRRLALPPELAAALARPYRIDSAGRPTLSPGPGPQGDGAAGGVISTALDLARFDVALSAGRLLSPSARAALWRPGRSPNGRLLPYGLGWFTKDFEGETLIWHTGLWEGSYSALYLKVPGRKLTLILLANSEGLQWPTRLDEAVAERSPFVRLLLGTFSR